jgi:hypothetical protein
MNHRIGCVAAARFDLIIGMAFDAQAGWSIVPIGLSQAAIGELTRVDRSRDDGRNTGGGYRRCDGQRKIWTARWHARRQRVP